MPYRYPDLVSLVIAAVTGLFGGIARWYENQMFDKPFHFWTFLMDMSISAGAGILVFWVVHDLGQPDSICAMCSAVTGNIGSRIFDIARVLIKNRLGGGRDGNRTVR